MENDYKKQARDFLANTGTELYITFIGTKKHFPDDEKPRDVYSVSLVRGDNSHTFEFGDSIHNTEENRHAYARKRPSAYDILACLTKYDPGDVESFALDYGYSKPSEAMRVYESVKREYRALSDMFSEKELEQLAEII